MNNDHAAGRIPVSIADTVAVSVGIVIGAGIFKTPSLVAANAGSVGTTLVLWLMGGVVSLIGALCYAELATAFPHEGGDYSFMYRAYGSSTAFMFAWARMTVIQTSCIALFAFIVGDYATEILPLGPYSSSIYAAVSIVILTVVNMAGVIPGVTFQKLLTSAILLGLLVVVAMGMTAEPVSLTATPVGFPGWAPVGRAMIFVLLTFGGWNEAVYFSAEVRNRRSDMARALLLSIAIITTVYLFTNMVYLWGLGLSGVASSEAVAADLARKVLGETGATVISAFIVIAVLSSMNGSIMTGARSSYAFGCDFGVLGFLGRWREKISTPFNSLVFQGAIAVLLVFMGTLTRRGFETMVEYTAPVFWIFFFLTGLSLFVLRIREPGRERPYRVPFYPVTPVLFCAFCLYMLISSLAYTGTGALVGVAVLAAGVPVMVVNAVLNSYRLKYSLSERKGKL